MALVAFGGAMLLGSAGCGSLIPIRLPEASEAGARSGDVLIVGKIDIIPPIAPGEQKIRAGSFGLDPADIKGKLQQRALLYLSDAPSTQREGSGDYINPRLGDWFAYWVPRGKRHITEAVVVMDFQTVITGRRQAHTQSSELLLPAPVSIDIQAQDSAVYVGSWRVWRDEFNSVTRIQANQELREAQAAVKRLVGRDVPIRTAIPKGLAR
ncbi:hypothetical protein [Ramlibacter sp. Leaf400]|uniref:hypothetical protein n=1 Tax=Ramlibacter sp. Leaf400 TaxID=1736365 RepID=UPI0006F4EE2E|nr:hypothetical protein [Ramlibacter sp. Leaf400]KQT10782.1 hypothetical protein ASG30_08195 [Ramlibacter sp. Leaf400]